MDESLLAEKLLSPAIVEPKSLLEKLMVILVSHQYLAFCIYLLQNAIMLIATFHVGPVQFLMNIIMIIGQSYIHRKRLNPKAKREEYNRLSSLELLCSTILLTIRFFLFKDRVFLLGASILFHMVNEYKFNSESIITMLFPTYHVSSLLFWTALYEVYKLMQGQEGSWFQVAEHLSLLSIVLKFCHYTVTSTLLVRNKISHLIGISKSLKEALTAKTTFLSHISHEFR